MNQSVYQVVTDRIIGLLEKNVVPWQKPWTSKEQAPRNLHSKHFYHGLNVFLLNSMGFSSPWWLTYNQAVALKGHVRKGEKGCPVVFWKWLDVEDTTTRENKRIPLLRYYTVFSVCQCDGLEAHIPTPPESTQENSPIEEAQKIVEGMPKRPEIQHGGTQACYIPSLDRVQMPKQETFRTSEDYYSVLFHELTHSTAAESRLNRKGDHGGEGQWANFGSESYSREELCAEMGSAFLCSEAGILERTVTNSSAYIQGWLQKLKNDSKMVVIAAAQAQKAAQYICGTTPEPDLTGAAGN